MYYEHTVKPILGRTEAHTRHWKQKGFMIGLKKEELNLLTY